MEKSMFIQALTVSAVHRWFQRIRIEIGENPDLNKKAFLAGFATWREDPKEGARQATVLNVKG
jgi:hypothetical protein